MPARGELIEHPSGIQFEVLDADPRRIRRLRIHMIRREEEQDTSAPATNQEETND